MAINTDELTVKASDIMSRPLRVRQEMASAGLLNLMTSALTPGQIAATFPSYIKDFTTGGPAKSTSNIPAFRGGAGGGNITPKQKTAAEKKQDILESIVPAGLVPGPDGKPVRPTDLKKVPGVFQSREDMENYIREAAKARGIDPEAAIKLYKSEGAGGQGPSLQSKIPRGGAGSFNGFEDSHGPFQLHRGGAGSLGTEFEKKTNLKIDDPTTFRQQIDFALDYAAQNGWAPWSGARVAFRNENGGVDYRFGISDEATPIGVSEYNPDSNVQYVRQPTAFDLTQQQIAEASVEETATPLTRSIDASGNLIPPAAAAGFNSDSVANPEIKRVLQLQEETANVRKGALDPDFANTMELTAQKLAETTNRNIVFEVTSGGQRMEGAWGAVGTHEHDNGLAGDFNMVEILPDGTKHIFDPRNSADALIINKGAEIFAANGGRSAGAEYMDDPTKLHFGVSRNNPASYAGSEDFQRSFDLGRKQYLDLAEKAGWDKRFGYKDLFQAEKQSREQLYAEQAAKEAADKKLIAQTTNASALHPEIAPAPTLQSETATALPIITTSPSTQSTSSKPAPALVSSLTGTALLPEHNAAAGGAQINQPYIAQPVDGSGPNILMGETGPENIVPRNRADDFGMQQYQMPQLPAPEPAKSDIVGAQNFQQPQYLPKPSFAPEPRQTPIVAEHTPIPPSLRKQYADSKMQNRLDNLSPIGSVYSNFGYA